MEMYEVTCSLFVDVNFDMNYFLVLDSAIVDGCDPVS